MTLGEWLRMATARLTHEGIASAPLEAQMLAAHVLGTNRTYVLTHPDLTIPEARFEAVLDRRSSHEPLAYILGWREFFGRPFTVTPAVLIPRQETELLVELALMRHAPEEPLHVLDIGTGSGALAVTLKLERPAWKVEATDISAEALSIAKRNSKSLGAEIEFHEADLFPSSSSPFDLIVCNPPYVAEADAVGRDVAFEPKTAVYAEENGLEVFRRLAEMSLGHLASHGEVWLEVGKGQADEVVILFEGAGWTTLGRQKDLAGIERAVGFQATH